MMAWRSLTAFKFIVWHSLVWRLLVWHWLCGGTTLYWYSSGTLASLKET